MSTPQRPSSPLDAEHERDLIIGRACCTCGVRITTEDRVPHGGFWRCQACSTPPACDCGHDKSWHEDFREKAAQPCLKCECVGFSTPHSDHSQVSS